MKKRSPKKMRKQAVDIKLPSVKLNSTDVIKQTLKDGEFDWYGHESDEKFVEKASTSVRF